MEEVRGEGAGGRGRGEAVLSIGWSDSVQRSITTFFGEVFRYGLRFLADRLGRRIGFASGTYSDVGEKNLGGEGVS